MQDSQIQERLASDFLWLQAIDVYDAWDVGVGFGGVAEAFDGAARVPVSRFNN